MVAPASKFEDSSKFRVDQYLMGGGKVAFLLNKMNVNLNAQYRFAQTSDLGLEDQLEHYAGRNSP